MMQGEVGAGYAKQAPYNAILICGGLAEVPASLLDQLADGGRLVTVLREGPEQPGSAVLYRKAGDIVSYRTLFDANTPILPGFQKEEGFVF